MVQVRNVVENTQKKRLVFVRLVELAARRALIDSSWDSGEVSLLLVGAN